METTVAVVDDQIDMEGDTVSDASQENEDLQPSDIVQSSKLKLSSDLEKSLEDDGICNAAPRTLLVFKILESGGAARRGIFPKI